MTTGPDIGFPAGEADATPNWRQHFDADSGELVLDEKEWFWEAVQTAHAQGNFGQGERIAVIDSGFDLALLDRLPGVRNSQAYPALPTLVQDFRGHGTIVASLVHRVAPQAEVLLFDAGASRGKFHKEFVAAGIEAAVDEGATVLNLSVQFETTAAPRDPEPITMSYEMSGDEMAQALDDYFAAVEPYADLRCAGRCLVCTALDAVPAPISVVAATGQKFSSTCPAVSRRAIGAAFQRTTREAVGGHLATLHEPGSTASITARHEVVINEPPGFIGTSFAAPLLSGFAALTGDAAAFEAASRFGTGLNPLRLLQQHTLQWVLDRTAANDLPPDGLLLYHYTHEAIRAGVIHARRLAPAGHQHWAEPSDELQPCALCELFLRDLYVIEVTDLIEAGRLDEALPAAERAVRICPNSPDTHNNLREFRRLLS